MKKVFSSLEPDRVELTAPPGTDLSHAADEGSHKKHESGGCPENKTFYQAKKDFVTRTIAGETLIIPVGAATRDFNGMAMLNETGAFLWETLQKPKTEEELVQAILDEFETDPETALADTQEFVKNGIKNDLISCTK